MTLRNTQENYGSVAKAFHWFIALAVIALLAVGLYMTSDSVPSSVKGSLYFYHKSFGLTVLFFMMFRILWRVLNSVPKLPESIPVWERLAAKLVHVALYVLLFALPISGWLMSTWAAKPPSVFGLFVARLPLAKNSELAGLMNTWHEVFAWAIIILLVLHIGAALRHHFIAKNHVLASMLPRWFR